MSRLFRPNRRFFILLLLLMIVLILLIILYRDRRVGFRESFEGRGLRAVDGDTYRDRDGSEVRLLGIDTPEKGEPYYRQAKERLNSLIHEKELRLEHSEEPEDRYGRELAFVFADTVFVNAVLVKEGLARTYFFPDDFGREDYLDLLCRAQKEALAAHAGIWSLAVNRQESRYFGNQKSFRFHRPSCSSVERGDTLEMLRFLTREEFLNLCYSPCRNCKP